MTTQVDIESIKDKATISIAEAGILLGIGRNVAYQAALKGTIPTLHFGTHTIRVPVPKLLAMLGVPDDVPKPVVAPVSHGLTAGELVGSLSLDASDEADSLPPIPPRSGPVRGMPIEDLNLTSVRAYNCLKREGIHTAGDLADCTEADLLDIRNFGASSIPIAREALAKIGLSLKIYVPEDTSRSDLRHAQRKAKFEESLQY